ncbi:amino acid ABC transporter permease [Sinirhodobacter huangdaonensis]|uniref:Amino acid ABC transporter permease n=1 Tax=Paenirhodobacter huangdaonensis TaxID=2501515 RepID=A0A3S3PI86_9RHOB|nr:amino acid ABC transporter permease [Sinirhodobacter huangdaonensis]RWR54652.1 amino acid ABC transporter permease [Sinirhodobacter huangdaonensis]
MIEFTLWDLLRNLLFAARWTLLLSAAAFIGGMIVGLVILFARIASRRGLRRVAYLYIEIFQGTPLLLFLIFFGLPQFGLRIEPWMAAALGLTIYASAYFAEIWRGGVEALPEGRWDAGASLGLTRWQELRLVILPQAFRITLGPTVGFLVQLIKATALASILGFEELVRTADALNNATFQPFRGYGLVVLLYFAMCFPLTRCAKWLETRQAGA